MIDKNDVLENGIAIVGISCRFPGARSLREYWDNLCRGKVSVTFPDRETLAEAGVSRELLEDPSYVRAFYGLSDTEMFDAAFFGYAGSEAEKIDPQQRMFLECCWEALEDAGYSPLPGSGLDRKSVGMFGGCRISTYLNQVYHGMRPGGGAEAFQCLVGNDKDYLCTRVSYKLNLHGPSISVQSACSSSLAAPHLACDSLRQGACDMALAGGAAVDVPQGRGYLWQKGMIFSPDGYCRPFDKNASGTVFSGGVGVVVLKRLEDALADRDDIYAVVMASAINNDGARRVGYTAPGEYGQTAVIAEAISLAGISPRDIGYVETHGTGTAIGDPIEFAALKKVFGRSTSDRNFCALGAVKANIGHADAAAGIASLIKAAMAVKTGVIPPNPLFTEANPAISLQDSPFYINTGLTGWKDSSAPRAAGVSSFGIGGSNAHVLLVEPPARTSSRMPVSQPDLFVLSSRNESMLRAMAGRMAVRLKEGVPLADFCYTARAGRSSDRCRMALMRGKEDVLAKDLERFSRGETPEGLLLADNVKSAGLESSSAPKTPDNAALAWIAGEPGALSLVQKEAFDRGASLVHLPGTPFQRKRCWPRREASVEKMREKLRHPVLKSRFAAPGGPVFYEGVLTGDALASLLDHKVRGTAIAPASFFIELMTTAGRRESGRGAVLTGFRILSPLMLEDGKDVFFELTASPVSGRDDLRLELFASEESGSAGSWKRIAQATAEAGNGIPAFDAPGAEAFPESVDTGAYYDAMHGLGVDYGPSFRLIRKITRNQGGTCLEVQETGNGWNWQPALLDACLQGVLACVPEEKRGKGRVFVPSGAQEIILAEKQSATMRAYLEIADPDALKKSDVRRFSVNVSITDSAGAPLGQIRGLAVSELSAEAGEQARQDALSSRLEYRIGWADADVRRAVPAGSWLLLGDKGTAADTVEKILLAAGCAVARAGFEERAGLPSLLSALPAGKGGRHVVLAWPLGGGAELGEIMERGVLAVLDIVQSEMKGGGQLDIVCLTSGAFGPAGSESAGGERHPGQGMLWGMAPVVNMEMQDMKARVIDVDAGADGEILASVLAQGMSGNLLSIRGGHVWEPRLSGARERREEKPRALVMEGKGLDALAWEELTRRAPGEGEVEVAVEASSLNFRDVMMAMGIYPGAVTAIGSDGAGRVTAVGSGVTGLHPGDRVALAAFGCLRSHVTLPAPMVCRIPDSLGIEQAAGLPVAYITAWYGLMELAHVKAGQTVLIHAASGGVGLATMSICRRAGARIFATAGNDRKRALVREQGAELVMDSRSAGFAEEVMKATQGRGADVVLNSLTGELQELSLNLVRDGGTFIELGKSGVRPLGNLDNSLGTMRYFPVDLVVLGDTEPELMAGIFSRVIRDCAEGRLDLLPVRSFDIDDYNTAFRFMLATRHTGKIVLRWPGIREPLTADGCELITGGLGDLGLSLARARVSEGCRGLILVSRREPGEREKKAMRELEAAGCSVRHVKADVTDYSALLSSVKTALDKTGPLTRIWHLAGVLDDGPLAGQNAERFRKVIAPKALGAWNLHRLDQELKLNLKSFALFSSSASFMGPRTQASYAAANAFLDELALCRRRLGLPALSVNFGAFRGTGMAWRSVNPEILSRIGIGSFTPKDGFAVMEDLLSRGESRGAVLDMDWEKYGAVLGEDRLPGIIRHLCSGSPEASFAAPSAGEERRDEVPAASGSALPASSGSVKEAVLLKAASILRVEPGSLDPDASLIEMGIDSLLALDLFNFLEGKFQVRLDRSLLFESPTVNGLAARVSECLGGAGKEEAREDAFPAIVPDPASMNEPFPLMGMQQAYWVGRTGALVLGNVSCHVYLEMASPDLDPGRMEEAWNRIIRRHGMLRCVILNDGRQRILPEMPRFRIPVNDLSGMTGAQAESAISEIRGRMGSEVLSAGEWPLYRCEISKMPDGSRRMHVSLDLLVADLHSMNLMMSGLATAYRHPERPDPEPTALSFRDYVLAQEKIRELPAYRKDMEYWLARIGDFAPAPDLPLAVSPSEVKQPHFVRHAARLGKDTWAALRKLAQERGITPSGLLLACYVEVLARWSSRSRFTVDVTMFNRLPMHPDVSKIIGDFTSVILLDCGFDGDLPFVKRAEALQKRLWADMDHGLYSGVDAAREWSRRTGHPGSDIIPVVFTSTLGFGDEHGTHPALSAFGTMVYTITQTPQVWIDHQVREVDDCLDFNWDSVDELFPAGLVDDMFGAYCRLLKMLAAGGRLWNHTRLPLLPEEQQERRILANATAVPSGVPAAATLDRLFAETLERTPDAPAIFQKNRVLTYRELGSAAEGLTQKLLKAGVREGSLCAVISSGGWQEACAAIAVTSAGAAYMPLDAALPEKRLKHLFEYSGARHVLLKPADAGLPLPENVTKIIIDDGLLKLNFNFDIKRNASRPDGLAYVIHTSGSTGEPKGVMIRHERAVNTILAVNRMLNLTSADRVLSVSRFTFDLSVWDIFGMFAAGGAIVLPDQRRRLDAAHWLELMCAHKVTVWNSVPPLLQIFADWLGHHEGADLPPLRCAMLSGDWIPLNLPGAVRRFWPDLRLFSLGGATEASIWSISCEVGEVDPGWKSIPYGKPLPNQRFHILNKWGTDCPDWVPGELFIAGRGLADGYLNDPGRTAERFIRHSGTGEKLYATGDLGCYMPDGSIEFLGRSDSQVKINGYRVELGEVENNLLACPGVGQAAAMAVRGAGAGQMLVAFASPAHGAPKPEPAELRKWLESRLPSFLVPGMIIVKDSLPLTANGKVDRRHLSVEPAARNSQPAGAAAGTETERIMAGAIGTVLRGGKPGIDQRFFEMGLSSLDLVTVQNLLEGRLHTTIPLMTLLEHTTIRSLAAWVDSQKASAGPGASRTPEKTHGTVSFSRGMGRAEQRMRRRMKGRDDTRISSNN